jgi:predicted DsbA family dithiol-disulfide isomerase
MTEMDKQPLQIDVVSDVMCPWCYIGKRRLETAIAGAELNLDIRWRPFQLDPTLPAGGKDRKIYLAEKFGSIERARELYENIRQAGDGESIPFAFDRIAVSPNTLDAHRLIRWAGGVDAAMQDRVVEALFKAYFIDGRNIGDHDTLAGIAREAGMDGDLVAELLAGEADRELVESEIAQVQGMGVTGVPTFILANKYALVGAQPAAQLAEALRTFIARQNANDNVA